MPEHHQVNVQVYSIIQICRLCRSSFRHLMNLLQGQEEVNSESSTGIQRFHSPSDLAIFFNCSSMGWIVHFLSENASADSSFSLGYIWVSMNASILFLSSCTLADGANPNVFLRLSSSAWQAARFTNDSEDPASKFNSHFKTHIIESRPQIKKLEG